MARACRFLGSTILLALSVALVAVATFTATASAQDASNKVVRVGWYDSSYNTVDKFGRRSGYAYEYQLKIAAYTGWSYEYVEGSWSDLLQMLIDDKIDLMSDVSYTKERAESMLYPDYPMGSEDYYLFAVPDNSTISSSDAIVLNIERFHSINALNGWEFGDQVLRVLGNDIRILAEEAKGIAGRFGADRFDVFRPHVDDYQAMYDHLQNKLETMAPNASIRLRMGVMPEQTELEPIQMFDMARTACSMARGHFAEHLIVFDEQVRERELYEQRLLNDLRRALDSYEFEVYYQPKFNIQSEPEQLSSAEALIRWQHPELGMITPDDFIPLFERSGKVEELDKYVWSQAARQVARWRAQYGVTIPVSVNLSRVDVFDPMLEDILDGILEENGLEHEALKLEVTESAYMENPDQLIRVSKSLRKKGYTVEMDDFGTGYSSLNMLSTIPIDVLKMDRAFIQNIDTDERTVRLVELILGIAKSLDVPVIAEGVETESQLQLLKQLGCSLVQGYYFSRPLHPSDFEVEYLER